MSGKDALEGRDVATSVHHILLRGGPDSPPFWVGDLGFVRSGVQEAVVTTLGFTKADNRVEGGETGGRDLEEVSSREVHWEGRNSVPRNFY